MVAKVSWLYLGGTINQHVHRRVLQHSLLPWERATFQNNFALVQDKVPLHTTRATRDFPENQDVEVMDWPSKSRDMNPIELDWPSKSRDMNPIKLDWPSKSPDMNRIEIDWSSKSPDMNPIELDWPSKSSDKNPIEMDWPSKSPDMNPIKLDWPSKSPDMNPIEMDWPSKSPDMNPIKMDWPSKSLDMNPVEHIREQMLVHISDMANPWTAAAKLGVAVQQVWFVPRPDRPWYRACCVQCVLSSLRVVVATTFTQPSTMPLIPSTDLQNLNNFRSQLFLVSSFCYGHYSLIDVTVAPPYTTAHGLHLPGYYSHWLCCSRISDFCCWNAFTSSPNMTT